MPPFWVTICLDEALRAWQLHAGDADAGEEALRREVSALIDELDSGASSGRENPAVRAAVEVGVDRLDRGEGILVNPDSLREHFSDARIRERQRRRNAEPA